MEEVDVQVEPAERDAARSASELPFWERPETVAWFAARPPDARVVSLFAERPRAARVLGAITPSAARCRGKSGALRTARPSPLGRRRSAWIVTPRPLTCIRSCLL